MQKSFYQIIDNSTGIAVWEGEHHSDGWNEYDKAIENRKKNLKESVREEKTLKEQIRNFIVSKYDEDWWNVGLLDNVNNYVSEEDMIGDGDEDNPEYDSLEDVYVNFANGGAIEHDLLENIAKDIMEKFNITSDEYYNKYSDIAVEHMKDVCSWYDSLVF